MDAFSRSKTPPGMIPRTPGFTRPIAQRPTVKIRSGFGRFGAASAPLADASAGASAGATAGSVIPGVGNAVGAAVGAVVGAVVGILSATNNTASHIGTWDASLVSALNGLPSTAQGIGRQIPWNENSHGLVQMIEALMACGIYMAWDTSLISNYAVCAHWATTFGQGVQNVMQGLVPATVGATVTVSVPLSPGAGGFPPINFSFKNPGISVGPDAIAATIIMGKSGLMGAMMTGLGGQAPQNIASNESNASAQKVYSLMVDYWAAQLAPAAAVPATPAPVIAPAVAAASTAANTAVSAGHNPQTAAVIATTPPPATPPTVVATTTAGTPVVAPDDTAALISQLIANGTSQTAAITAGLASLEANGIDSSAPASQAALASAAGVPAPAGFFGLSNTEILIGGVALAALLFFMSGHRNSGSAT